MNRDSSEQRALQMDEPRVLCQKCKVRAVFSYESEPEKLFKMSAILGLGRELEPYFVIDYPFCGRRIQETSAPEWN